MGHNWRNMDRDSGMRYLTLEGHQNSDSATGTIVAGVVPKGCAGKIKRVSALCLTNPTSTDTLTIAPLKVAQGTASTSGTSVGSAIVLSTSTTVNTWVESTLVAGTEEVKEGDTLFGTLTDSGSAITTATAIRFEIEPFF